MLCLKKSKDAVTPERAGPNEIGFDLTLIRKVKEIDDFTIMYDTDIVIKPPDGFYVEIVPRSSIVKSGWFMANGIGIIDPTYRDTLKVVLKRVDKLQPEVPLPSRLCQLILRPVYRIVKVDEKTKIRSEELMIVDSLDETERKGGFGSTDTQKLKGN
jgi:dUTP pyrophosphatase